MSKAGNSDGRDDDVSAPTIEHNVTVAAPTPHGVPSASSGELGATTATPLGDSNPMADTAVASRSQAMAAVSPPDESSQALAYKILTSLHEVKELIVP